MTLLLNPSKNGGITREAGVNIIAPYGVLCAGSVCKRFTQAGDPLYKDADHLRASFVSEHANHLDPTLIVRVNGR